MKSLGVFLLLVTLQFSILNALRTGIDDYESLPSGGNLKVSRVKSSKDDLAVKITGDLTLGGLFSVHAQENELQCGKLNEEVGIHRLEAMLYAVDVLNANPEILPNITLGVDIRDDCETVNTGLEQCLNFLLGSMHNKNGVCSSSEIHSQSVLVGVVGPAYSSLAIQVASLLRLFHVPQVSYSATSSELSEKNRFDYFLRTVPPDSFQAQAIVDIIKSMNWSAVFSINSRGSYGEGGIRSFSESVTNSTICTVYRYQLKSKMTAEDFDAIFTSYFKKKSSVRVVVLFCNNEDVREILAAAKRQNLTRHYTWLASDFWGSKYKHLAGLEDAAEGAITIDLETHRDRLEPFYKYFFRLTPDNNIRNPWFKEYWQNHFRCQLGNVSGSGFPTRCYGNESYDSQRNYDSKVSFVIDAVWAFGYALNHLHQDSCGGKPGLCDVMKKATRPSLLSYLYNVTFNGTNGTIKFNRNGDTEGRYDILQFKKHQNSWIYERVGKWVEGNLDLDKESLVHSRVDSQCGTPCKLGYVRRMDEVKCCWSCVQCDKHQFIKDNYTCAHCPHGQKPSSTFEDCEDLPQTYIAPIWVIIIASCAGVGLLATFFVISVFLKFMKTPLIMAAGREMSAILFLGIGLCYIFALVRVIQPTSILCGLRRFGTGFAFCLCYSSLLVKTNRIARIFRGTKSPSFISPKSQLAITVIILFPQVGIALAELFVFKPKTKLLYSDPNYVVITCDADNTSAVIQLCYNVVLILLCTYYAFLTRKTPLNFNEAKFIGFCMYTTCVIWVAFLPMYYGMGGEYESLAVCCSLILSATTILIFIFVPKVYIVLFKPEKNLRSNSRLRSRTKSLEESPVDRKYSENEGTSTRDDVISNYSPSYISSSPNNNQQLDLKTLRFVSI